MGFWVAFEYAALSIEKVGNDIDGYCEANKSL